MPQAGERIGPYTLMRQLGRGAFGLVWLAERRGAFATTQVALKIALDEEPDLEAITQESQLWAQLGGHPNVLPIIEADKYDQYVVIVSEYAPDGTLDSWLKKHGGVAPSIEAAIAMTLGILNGLEHLHSRRVIHRDLKPANILLQGDTPRLADFGLARVLKSSLQSAGVAGTPAYMAPEVFDGERSVQSDLWSVGVILYQMLSGRLPFPQSDLMALLGAIIKNDLEPLPNYIPFALAQVIGHSLQKNPTNRYQSVIEMRSALQAITSSGDIVPTTLRMLDDNPTLFDDKPTLVVNAAKQTNPEQTAATLLELALRNNAYPPQQNSNKTLEQVPALATQQVTQEISQSIPATQKIPSLNLEHQSDKPKGLSKSATATRVAVFVVLFLLCWAGLSQLPGSFGKFFPFPFLSQKNNATANNIDRNASTLNNQPKSATPKVDMINTDVIKDSNKLAMEIGKRIALLEDAIPKLPNGKEKTELQEAFEGIQDGFEEISSEDIKPETLKPLYEGYIVGLDSLMISVENLKLEVKPKVKTSPTSTSETAVSKSPLPPSPNISLRDQKENIGVEFGKPIETQQVELPASNTPLAERLKELRRKTKEMRQIHKEAQRQLNQQQTEQSVDPLAPRRFMNKKAIREEEKEEKRERKERKAEREAGNRSE